MDTVKKIERLFQIVQEVVDTQHRLAEGPGWEEFERLDAEICGECVHLGVSMPPYSLGGAQVIPFGFVQIPRFMTNLGWRLHPAVEWQQAVRGLRAAIIVALERQIEPNDIATAKTQAGIATFAEEQFGTRPSERTIQNWIAGNSLRARQRGLLWEFSKSDLRTLAMGTSE